MEERTDNSHLVLGGLLFLVFSLVVALVFVYTRAGDTTTGESPATSAEIANEAPVVDTVNVAYALDGSHLPAIDLAVGTTKNIVVWGVASDPNGSDTQGEQINGDIDNISAVFYRTGATGGDACTEDKNDCYKVAACTIDNTYGNSTEVKYSCPMSLEFFTDSTTNGGEFPSDNWTAIVKVVDKSTVAASNTNTSEMNTLLALNIPTTIPYGSFALGATTTATNNQDMVIEQRGNARGDVEVSGSDMTCSGIGTIPVGKQKWALSDVGESHASSTALTASAIASHLNVNYRKNDATAETKTLTWNIGIPATGVRGVCTGTNTLTVKSVTP